LVHVIWGNLGKLPKSDVKFKNSQVQWRTIRDEDFTVGMKGNSDQTSSASLPPICVSRPTQYLLSSGPIILNRSRTDFPSLYFWFFSWAVSYFHPKIDPHPTQKMSQTACIPVIIILSSISPTVTFTLGNDIFTERYMGFAVLAAVDLSLKSHHKQPPHFSPLFPFSLSRSPPFSL